MGVNWISHPRDKALENRVQRRICGSKKDEVTEEWTQISK